MWESCRWAWYLYLCQRHVLCEKQGKINEAYKKLQDGWLSNGDKVPPKEFAKAACKSFPDDQEAPKAINLLYDSTLVWSGLRPDNPAQLGGKIYEMMDKWSS
ncbi:uncharacterized protein LOC131637784 isoform X2 [Vicia villosa]|uniref:uncharacterized protein LOC131602435 isoform X2 n=1 Tax=Vicia villosa TaxID=3911 RepID=UPI00273B1236|nr:uncharacterized protein LOC131602435 isoform X2 [Vicia villosa]XP_058730532.1 uncharacterized protein LOC131602435 isoform X2 [Vicia villosa]XP_058730533.1 uncharacterized protein LOC131602435 isoform X2 [Vicia villosa]XP_058737035.1 uncharacterized protein LOC131609366 isoform X2 [Vicia villosa]XP_058737037.1 uncharacterized protein LOC131609366 isoform X2 [Vicia villosa]XP_058764337.1 uncharacterized protein LOC131637784 isoform X2 [Vicia villosa]XP_058764338.1 uncharacterized protein LO